ncbi:acyl-CoA synthetase (AMP-forming)/AMP-acid ligase II [Microbacterium sp. SORGH_AS 888]|nr:acyl-CoA synthetase (AMP-forming)/AMP-acid ligase II [Microbacterium sp. SORGH_AS_0888]
MRASAPALLDPESPVASFLPHRATQLVAGPMWHSAVFTYAFRGLLTGHRLVIMSRFDPREWLDLVEAHGATWGMLVPTMMSRLLRLRPEVRDRARLRSIDRVLHMGAPCPPDLKRAFLEWLGPERVDEVYAGSESNGLTHITGTEWLARPGSVGRGIGGTSIRILDHDGRELPAGRPGLIWMHRGDASTYEYVGASSRRDAQGWDTLADVGHLDDDGYLYIHDRADDMINRGGDKIAPATIEAVLESHPGVLEAAAFGVPDEDLGQAVHAVVRVGDADEPLETLLAYAAQRLGSRAPTTIHRTTEPIRNDAGKLRRARLAARYRIE